MPVLNFWIWTLWWKKSNNQVTAGRSPLTKKKLYNPEEKSDCTLSPWALNLVIQVVCAYEAWRDLINDGLRSVIISLMWTTVGFHWNILHRVIHPSIHPSINLPALYLTVSWGSAGASINHTVIEAEPRKTPWTGSVYSPFTLTLTQRDNLQPPIDLNIHFWSMWEN